MAIFSISETSLFPLKENFERNDSNTVDEPPGYHPPPLMGEGGGITEFYSPPMNGGASVFSLEYLLIFTDT